MFSVFEAWSFAADRNPPPRQSLLGGTKSDPTTAAASDAIHSTGKSLNQAAAPRPSIAITERQNLCHKKCIVTLAYAAALFFSTALRSWSTPKYLSAILSAKA